MLLSKIYFCQCSVNVIKSNLYLHILIKNVILFLFFYSFKILIVRLRQKFLLII